MEITSNLNENQIKAVEHLNGPCLVLAGAGSGKTKVLTTRIASLINKGISANNILAITFTNKASKEMKSRVFDLIGNNQAFIGTFHAFGVRLIKENHTFFNLQSNFTILDTEDTLTVIKKIMRNLGYDIKVYAPSFIKNKISFIKNEMLTEKEAAKYLTSDIEKIALEVYFRYEKEVLKNNAVDFDDLLKLPVEMFLKDKKILEHYQEKYRYILVDEYQDTNEVQYKMINILAQKYRNLFVVGDVNQCIYAFRGSNYQNILNFEKDYPESKIITLNQNYRSTTTILDAANDIIKNNKERKDVFLFSNLGQGLKIKYMRSYDEKHEVTLILEEINKLLNSGYKYEDIAILYRTNGQARIIEEGMVLKNLPYKVVGSYYFYKRKEIKDLLCYLRLIANPNDDVSLRRIINEPKRGIGNTSLDDIEKLAKINKTSMFDALTKPKEIVFKNLILALQKEALNCNLTELIDAILEKSGMKECLEKENNLEAEIRLENLKEFRSVTENYQNETGSVNLTDFLDEISIVSDISEHQDIKEAITLMTMHSAKGLEFKIVFLAGMEENIMPHAMSLEEKNGLEEERRLCYVAITRAKERLYLSNAKKRMLYGNIRVNAPSRFITEINKDLIEIDERTKFAFSKDKKIDKKEFYSAENTLYQNGEVVYHDSFGKGVVVKSEEKFVTVAFNKNVGIKKFISNYKGLKKGK